MHRKRVVQQVLFVVSKVMIIVLLDVMGKALFMIAYKVQIVTAREQFNVALRIISVKRKHQQTFQQTQTKL